MADYIYLLQTRLTPAQQTALQHVREAARQKGMTVFLVGGAVRDLTNGTQVRDLDIAVQGNATKLKKDIQKLGFTLMGESDPIQSAWYTYPGGVRLEVGSTLTATWPKPGKPVYKPANILDDLRRRDFTANSMAISLNEGSFGLLMDPLNGVADIENRELRLVSNYGFIEDPVRMIRAQRLAARLGWHLEEKTEQRYQTGKAEGYISVLSAADAGHEVEAIFHEEDPLRVLRRLEQEGWMKVLSSAWTASKANESEIEKLRDIEGQLESMGIYPDAGAALFGPLTAKLAPKDVAALKKQLMPGFVEQIAGLEPATKTFAAQFTDKKVATPSEAWKLLYASHPDAILWLWHTTKSAPIKAKFEAFVKEWSQARNKIPYQLMQEMRITPELPVYEELIEKLFYAIMDGKLETPEAAKAFLEPYSPPAPPPPITLRRRAVKKEAKTPKSRAKKVVAAAATPTEGELETVGAVADVVPLPDAPSVVKPEKAAPAAKKAEAPKKAEAKAAAAPAKAAKAVPAKAAPVKAAVPVKKASAPAKKAPAKPAPKPVAKKVAAKAPAKKAPVKVVKKAAPAKKVVAKKPAPKPVKKAAPAKKVVAKKAPAKKAVAKKKR